MQHPLFCFNIVGLSPEFLDRLNQMPHFSQLLEQGLKSDLKPVFPCLTLPAQASVFTGTYPGQHGIIANGFYDRDRFEVSFWDQYRSLVQADTLWEQIKTKKPDFKTALLFCQNSLYGNADIIITPKPMHTDDGLVQWCYSKPVGLYEQISKDIGRPFNLMDYWGPFASAKASEWIMDSAIEVVKQHQPDLMMTYIPHLDYCCQKYGPSHPSIEKELEVVDQLMGKFLDMLKRENLMEKSTVCIFSEYSLSDVNGAVFLNQALRQAGFLAVRTIEDREYLDCELSRAFAMVDHQVAHIYIKNSADIPAVKNLIESMDGVDSVLDAEDKKAFHIHHKRSGELVVISDSDKWFTYYWWDSPDKAPDYAENIDIHRKPGYDPVELFMDMETFKIPQAPEKIKGSHGAPPKENSDTKEAMAVFMLSGKGIKKTALPQTLSTVEIASILKQLLETDHV